MTRPKVGFLGTGWIGRNRMEALIATGLIEAAAICEPDEDCAREALALAPLAKRVASFDDLLAQRLDGIVIATPSALHAAQSIAALNSGAAVFCQKPLGRDAAETAKVVEAARQADRLLGIDLSYRHVAAVAAIAAAINDGYLGEIYAVDLTFHNAYGPGKPWFFDRALSGGGCVIDLGVHLMDLALWVLDFPQVTTVHSRLFRKGRRLDACSAEVEDYAIAQIDVADGATIQLACSWNLNAGCDAVIEAAFHGTAASVVLRNVGGSFYDFAAFLNRGTAQETIATPPDDWGGRAAIAWARSLASGRRFDDNAARAVDVAAVLDRIYQNA